MSEGRDHGVIERLADVIRSVGGVTLMNVHSDADHHRTVFSFLGAPACVEAAALALAARVIELIDLRRHRGVHPRVGALDVLPLVPLAGISMAETIALARRVGDSLASQHALPVYYYGAAATRPGRRTPRARASSRTRSKASAIDVVRESSRFMETWAIPWLASSTPIA